MKELHAPQLELFKEYQIASAHLSRVVPLWDLLPLYLFSRRNEIPPGTAASDILPRRHEFAHREEQFSVEVRPALIRTKGQDKSRFFYPGEREQLVAETLRALAVRGAAHFGTAQGEKGTTLVTIAFTIRQLRAELEATRHSFSHPEIVESLDILGKTVVSISRTREGHELLHDEFNFYTRHMQQGDKRIIVLNPIESQQILAGAYRSLNYSRLMALPDPLSRWLYQYLHAEHRGVSKPELGKNTATFEVSLSTLFERGIIPQAKVLRHAIYRVRNALKVLAEAGVLHTGGDNSLGYVETLEYEPSGGRRKITSAAWRPIMSFRDADEIINENSESAYRKPGYEHMRPQERISRTSTVRDRLVKAAEPVGR